MERDVEWREEGQIFNFFQSTRFDEVVDAVLQLKDHKTLPVKKYGHI